MPNPLNEMALTRDAWKARVSKRLYGGLGEWYKHRIAERAGLSADRVNGHLVDHWKREAMRLAGPDLIDAYLTQIKGRQSKPKAFNELVTILREDGATKLRRWAKRYVEDVFKTEVRLELTDPDLEPYVELAQASVAD